MQTDRRKIRQIIAKHFKTSQDDSAVIRCAEEILTGKVGDIMDGVLAFAISPEAAKEKAVLDELEQGLGVNIKRDEDAVKNARNIRLDMETHPTRTVSRWLAWCRGDEWRLGHLNIYRDTYRIWGEWPQQDNVNATAPRARALPPMMD